MSEHLAVVSPRTLRRLLRTKGLTWTRRRREAPVGRVHVGDQVFFKYAGQRVIAAGTVARVRETRQGGRYVISLNFRQFRKLSVPFPVIKRDRRNWVVCAAPDDARQQRLIATPPPSVRDLLQAVHAGCRRLPSRRTVRTILSQLAHQQRTEGSLLLWLALIGCLSEGDGVTDAITEYARKPARRVVPFAVFS